MNKNIIWGIATALAFAAFTIASVTLPYGGSVDFIPAIQRELSPLRVSGYNSNQEELHNEVKDLSHGLPLNASMLSIPLSEWNRVSDTPTSHLLKVYVYETLPAKYTTDVELFLTGRAVHGDDSFNMADLALIQLFKTYPGRTFDPNEADIFVVPYSHAGHCLQMVQERGWYQRCKQVRNEEIDEILASLKYYNATTKPRHLFLLGALSFFTNKRLDKMPLKATKSEKKPSQLIKNDLGTIVVPYLKHGVSCQKVFERVTDAKWWTRPREFSFTYVFGRSNKRTRGDPRRVRRLFEKNVMERSISRVGGLPYFMQAIERAKDGSKKIEFLTNAHHAYENSVFCPVLAGDSAQQARFFDAIMMGCLPVVLNYAETDMEATNDTSWYRPGGSTTMAVYPFHSDLYRGKQDFGINYKSFVLQVDAVDENDGPTHIIDAMQDLLANPSQLREMQLNMMNHASKVAFGLGPNAHLYNDSFAETLRMIRYYLDELD